MSYVFAHRDTPQMDESESVVVKRFAHAFGKLNRENGSRKWAYISSSDKDWYFVLKLEKSHVNKSY